MNAIQRDWLQCQEPDGEIECPYCLGKLRVEDQWWVCSNCGADEHENMRLRVAVGKLAAAFGESFVLRGIGTCIKKIQRLSVRS